MKNQMIVSFKVLGLMTLLFGIIYPLGVTLVAQVFFPKQANGSLVRIGDRTVGSSLLAQKTTSEKYFWPRPSASDFGAVPSGASNLGPTSKAFRQAVAERKEKGLTHDLLYASGSGLDPHITLDAALSQIARIVQSRNLGENGQVQIQEMIQQRLERRDFGIFGEPRVNVLLLNLEMDKTFSN